jgi:hypothetical protein
LRRSYVARFVRMVSMKALWVYEHRNEPQWTVGGVVEENPDWGGPTPGLVEEINRRVTASGSRLVVMAVPSRYRLMGDQSIKVEGDFHETVKQFTADRHIEFLDLYQPFLRASSAGVPLFFLKDIHFAVEGHRLVAATIGRSYPQFFPHATEITGEAVKHAYATP